MQTLLIRLRQTAAQPTPAQFLRWQPGCWVQYYDDTPAKNPARALSTCEFDPGLTRRKQAAKCAVCFSLQAFHGSRTKEGLLSFRNLGVDVDLVPAGDRDRLSPKDTDRRKEAYLVQCLRPFPLRPHWLIETQHGFHFVFRVMPFHDRVRVAEAVELNRRLVRTLRGDENAALLTQVLRVPGTRQFKDPRRPFLCRLLLDAARVVPPYELGRFRSVLDAWEVFHGTGEEHPNPEGPNRNSDRPNRWEEILPGVAEGQRNCTAAAVVGGILGRLPLGFWEVAGWGGLKEWNARNAAPLAERKLRAVYESIARREQHKRQRRRRENAHRPDAAPAALAGRDGQDVPAAPSPTTR